MKNLPDLDRIGATPSSHDIFDLTHREWDVLLQVSEDLSNAEIAEHLCLTTKSVENYRTRISCKLNLQGSRKLACFARKHYDELRQWYKLITGKIPPPPSSLMSRLCYMTDTRAVIRIKCFS